MVTTLDGASTPIPCDKEILRQVLRSVYEEGLDDCKQGWLLDAGHGKTDLGIGLFWSSMVRRHPQPKPKPKPKPKPHPQPKPKPQPPTPTPTLALALALALTLTLTLTLNPTPTLTPTQPQPESNPRCAASRG